MTDAQFVLYIISQYLVAIGTIGAVIAALFGDYLLDKFWPPKLQLQHLDPEGDLTTLRNVASGAYIDDARYYHVQVSNDRHWRPATNLDVRLVQVEEPGPDGQPQVKWVGDSPICCRDQHLHPLRHTIGSSLDFDICSVLKNAMRLQLHPIVAPNNLRTQRVGPCHLVLWLQAKSTEGDSEIMRFKIDWNGQWHDGEREMRDNLKITPLPTPTR